MSSVVPYDLANKESTPWGVLKKKKEKKKECVGNYLQINKSNTKEPHVWEFNSLSCRPIQIISPLSPYITTGQDWKITHFHFFTEIFTILRGFFSLVALVELCIMFKARCNVLSTLNKMHCSTCKLSTQLHHHQYQLHFK